MASKVIRVFLEVTSVMMVLAYQPYRPVVFMGDSMAPTYANREVAIASTDIGQVAPGDIVVIKRGEGQIVKRVIQVAGDSIDYYKIGNEWLCGLETTFNERDLGTKFPHRQVRVPEGFVFVMGDNWLNSVDSRHFGLIPVSTISAKLPFARERVPLPGEKLASMWRSS